MDRTDLNEIIAKRKKPRICEVCGIEYVPITPNQKYCSMKCQRLSRKKRGGVRSEVVIRRNLSDNMRKIYDLVKDDPGYGMKVARKDGWIK